VPSVPVLVALIAGDTAMALECLAVAVVMAGAGALAMRSREPPDVRKNEVLAAAALAFIIAGALMAWPLADGGRPSIDSLFESVSAITTTGLSTLASTETASAAFLFTRAWMQWCGGYVIVILAAALIMEPGIAARQLAGTDTANNGETILSGSRANALRLLVFYAALTVLVFLAVLATGAGAFDALIHTLSAISTGGFSSHDQSIAALPLSSRAVLSVASILGAVSFSVYLLAWQGGWRGRKDLVAAVSASTRLLAAIAVVAVIVMLSFALNAGDLPSMRDAVDLTLLAVSAQTTTGFAPLPVGDQPAATQLALAFSMLVGGDAGSTAGGIKIFRLLLLISLARLLLLRAALPAHTLTRTASGGRIFDEEELQTATGLVGLYALFIAGSWLVFAASGIAPAAALFDIVSAISTTGLSAGVTSPDLAAHLKLVLIFNMLLGRLEIVAVLVLLSPHTWIEWRNSS
jgi:trk system potassium uptake protein TrkH